MSQSFKVRMLRDSDQITHDPIRAANFWWYWTSSMKLFWLNLWYDLPNVTLAPDLATLACLTTAIKCTATDLNGCCFRAPLWCVSEDMTIKGQSYDYISPELSLYAYYLQVFVAVRICIHACVCIYCVNQSILMSQMMFVSRPILPLWCHNSRIFKGVLCSWKSVTTANQPQL